MGRAVARPATGSAVSSSSHVRIDHDALLANAPKAPAAPRLPTDRSGDWLGAWLAITAHSLLVPISARLGAPDLNVGMNLSLRKLDQELPTPGRSHPGDAGIDLYARHPVVLEPGQRAVVHTGVAVAIPGGHAGLVVPRSGMAARSGIGIVNSPGLIDAGYRGEVRVMLVNHGDERVPIGRGDRIAQLVVVPVALPEVVEVAELDETSRGEGGLGSSGR